MIEGIDVSKWQLRTPTLVGQAFLFARATIGTVVDPMYATHIKNAKAAGLLTGAYHFNWDADEDPRTPDTTPEQQARAFVSAAGKVDFLFLDVEGARAFEPDESRRFIREVHRMGRKIGMYHSRSGFPSAGQDYNWVADYRPGRIPTGIKWHFWQWTSSPWDRNRFNGDKAALLRLAGLLPTPIVTKVAAVPAKVLADLRRYIATLAGIARPTVAQRTKLAVYRKRLVEYLKRGRHD